MNELTGKYFTKKALLECVKSGPKWGYNRQLNEKIKRLSARRNYPVVDYFEHHHKAFEPCEAHMRCLVLLKEPGRFCFVDVPMWFWRKLPMLRIKVAA